MELIDASEENNINEVIRLLNTNVNINIQDEYGLTALMYVSRYGIIDIFKLLCNFDRRSKFTGQSGFQPDCSLLKKENIDINLQTKYGKTALIIALLYGHIDIVRLLLEREDIDINLQDNNGWTALMSATSNNKIVILLLEKENIYINLQDKYGQTALIFASNNGSIDTVNLLNDYNSLLSLTILI
jgi:serine/threonine-protein phosphatase 6 regulatory ankyrin repeat subunit B